MSYTIKDYVAKGREAIAEGFVLLKNEQNILPLNKNEKIAVFGRTQFDYFKSGTGSGGLVNTSYVINILDALEAEKGIEINSELKATYVEWLKDNPFDEGTGWATEPWFQKEMPINEEIVLKAKEKSEVAVVIIGRTAGEDKDNKVAAGSYLLTEDEENILENVGKVFDKVVVLLNTGNIIDMNWVNKYNTSAVAYVWQGGQEGGNGVVDVLMGRVTPSGKLPNTIVYDVNDIFSTEGFGNPVTAIYSEDIYVGYRYFETFAPEKVMYPFGFGMSYTNFKMELSNFSKDITFENNGVKETGYEVSVKVTNTGAVAGKEVVQVYFSAPQGVLGKAAKSLCGFTKTKLLAPNESETVKILISKKYLASYDDSGVTGNKSAYLLEKGTYKFFVGNSVRNTDITCEFDIAEMEVLERLSEAMAPTKNFKVLKPKFENGKFIESMVDVAVRTVDVDKKVEQELPVDYEITGDKGYKLSDVANGKVTIEEFIAQLSIEDLAAIVRGEGMCSTKVTQGIAGAFGGVTDSLKDFGIPIAGCSDGPSGIRMDCGTLAFSMPNGTLLAATFNEKLNQELYEFEALELRKNKIDNLLGPGINIHRSPLNGRNFEYFSEDPILTGKLAVAQLRGLHKYNVTGTIKHFVCNNQETNRHNVESVVSERAIREIYLKGFEIAIKEASAYAIMTSYNPVNGYWTASSYDLLTVILRNEWGFKGIAMTDWWAKGNFTGGEGTVANTSAKARAQNDLNMVNTNASDMECDNALESIKSGKVTIGAYQRCAINICEYLLRTPAYNRQINGIDELEDKLKDFVFEGNLEITKTIDWYVEEEGSVLGSEIATNRGNLNLIKLSVKEFGDYNLSITCRASEKEPDMAQIPLTIFKDKEIFDTVTIVGVDKEWKTYTFKNLNIVHIKNCYIKLLFGQGGMEVKELKLIRKN